MASRKRSATPTAEMPATKKVRDDDVYENKELERAIKREKSGRVNIMNSPLFYLPDYPQVRRFPELYQRKAADPITPKKITQLNATNSPLLRLPGELKNQVYGYVLGDLELEFVTFSWVADEGDRLRLMKVKRDMLSLLSTCKQVYQETALLPYALNTFSLQTYSWNGVRALLEKRSNAQIKTLKRVRVKLGYRGQVFEMSGLEMARDLQVGR